MWSSRAAAYIPGRNVYLPSTLDASARNLLQLAEETDGRAIVNRNTLAAGLAQIARDSSYYYLLGYTSSQPPTDGRFHQIRVRVTPRGLDVRARKGYYRHTTMAALQRREPSLKVVVSAAPHVEIAPERQAVEELLDYHRATLLWKCGGLTGEQPAQRSCPPSTLSLLGLVRHLAEVERSWFRRQAAGQDVDWIYCTEASPDGDFDDVADANAGADFEVYRTEVTLADEAARSRSLTSPDAACNE